MRVRFSHHIASSLPPILIVLALVASSMHGAAQAPRPTEDSSQTPAAQMTLAIFTDRSATPLSDSLWQMLVTTLKDQLASGSQETAGLISQAKDPAAGAVDTLSLIQIIRGEQIVTGMKVQNSITVYLHGECNIIPRPSPLPLGDPHVSGVLGWVPRDHGHIQPFIHVECERLSQMLAAQAFGHNREQRDQLLANAIDQVILHEWIHIATQSSHHSEHGVNKAQFNVNDLSPRLARPSMPGGTR